MGRMYILVNFTKKEQICVGKSGEEPVIQILKEMKKRFEWDLNDMIELVDDDILWDMGYTTISGEDESKCKNDGMKREIFLDRENEFPWKERSKLWKNLPMKNEEIDSSEDDN